MKLILAMALLGAAALAQEHATHEHHEQVNQRGDRVMGFGHTRTTHHFQLSADGGAITVDAKEAADHDSIAAIRKHLREQKSAFERGDFANPEQIHAQAPPGAEEMKRAAQGIRYSYEESPRGARVRISSAKPEAVAAVHRFLRFQIEEHQTGDPVTVQ